MQKQLYLWLAVTADKYELPLTVADSAKELGEIYGVSKQTVKNCVLRNVSGTRTGRKFVKVRIEE